MRKERKRMEWYKGGKDGKKEKGGKGGKGEREMERKRGSRKERQGEEERTGKGGNKGGGGRRKRALEKSHIVTASNDIISKSFGVLPRTSREGSLFHHSPGWTATIPVPFRPQLLLAFKPLSH